ncbi:MAG TPA: hypothetical protein VF519_16885 [Mycobacteriales bacterium]|jgi:hypothetical protein
MNHVLGRLALPIATATALLVAGAPAAHAAPTDLALATAETEVAIATAAVRAAQHNVDSPEVTCATPAVAGTLVVPPVYRDGVGSVWGIDQAAGEGHCASFQELRYSVTLLVEVQAWVGPNTWTRIPGCFASNSMPAFNGAGNAVVTPFLCTYDPAGIAAGKPHRVHGQLTNSATGKVYDGYSQVYLTPQPDDLAGVR